MKPDEKEFEKFICDLEFDDKPDYAHRDKLEKDLLASLKMQSRQKPQSLKIWRNIMNSKITKLSAAAAVLILIAVLGWFYSNPDSAQQISSFTFLSRASAAEKTLYSPDGIVHIVNEIILHPKLERDASDLLRELEADTTQDKNIAFIKSWLSYQWLPVYSLKANGQLQEHKLELAKHIDNTIVISDLSWYDTATGRFVRILKTDDQVLFANAYDGESVYLTRKGPGGIFKIEQEAVSEDFQVPVNPADFMGIAAGIKSSVPKEHYPPILDVTTETLEDGKTARVYKMGFTDVWGNVDTYFLFKVRTNTDIIDVIECIVKGSTTRVHRRLVAEKVDSPEFSWNLSELKTSLAKQTDDNVDAIEGANIVNVQYMAQHATSPVYIFSEDPSWTKLRVIYDLPDSTNPTSRFFCVTYHSKDGRDIALSQGESFTRYFSAVFGKFQELGEQIRWMYESENGFKVWNQNDKKTELWWTEFALRSSGFNPQANRVGYILQSPTGTYLVLAINGPVSEQELRGLIDSLIPAEEYVPDTN
jgi:hypothetical protein